jgi:hypothetical protein
MRVLKKVLLFLNCLRLILDACPIAENKSRTKKHKARSIEKKIGGLKLEEFAPDTYFLSNTS